MDRQPINDFERRIQSCAERLFEQESSDDKLLVTFLKTDNIANKQNLFKRMLTTLTQQAKT